MSVLTEGMGEVEEVLALVLAQTRRRCLAEGVVISLVRRGERMYARVRGVILKEWKRGMVEESEMEMVWRRCGISWRILGKS